jgi:hypothetical protein
MLNGSLDTVALPDVLRLIATSGKSGLLRITDASPSGRVFIVDGRIAFATNRNEEDPFDDLLHMEYRADYVGSPEDRRIVDLGDLIESNPDAFERFLEQMIVEVLSRLLRVTEGEFRFDVDIRSRREIPSSFDVEEMISQAGNRADAWTRIFQVVPSAAESFRMAPRLGQDEDVVLAARDWALLAATGEWTTINQIAQDLKIFEFAAAKKVAELTQRGLIEFVSTEVSEESVEAAGILSEVAEATGIEFEVPLASSAEAPRQEQVGEPEPAEAVALAEPGPEAEPEGPADDPSPVEKAEVKSEDAGPTWLPIDDAAQRPNGPDPLLEELHRLHEADAAAKDANTEPSAEVDGPAPAKPAIDDDLEAESVDDGDLATRWKNLRKAKRGAHASNE